MRAVHLEIDRIVVDGLAEGQQQQFARSLEEHLHAWAAGGIAAGTRVKLSTLDAGPLPRGATASQAARLVVNSLARRLGASAPTTNARQALRAGARRPKHV